MIDKTAATSLVTQALADYYRAFSSLNIHDVLRYFHDPALFISHAGVLAVPDPAALAAVFGRVMDDLRARGYDRSELELEKVHFLSDTTAVATGVVVR